MKQTNKITEFYAKIIQLLNEEKYEEADEQLDLGIVYLARQTNNGVKKIDNVSINLWKERLWQKKEITWNVLDPD